MDSSDVITPGALQHPRKAYLQYSRPISSDFDSSSSEGSRSAVSIPFTNPTSACSSDLAWASQFKLRTADTTRQSTPLSSFHRLSPTLHTENDPPLPRLTTWRVRQLEESTRRIDQQKNIEKQVLIDPPFQLPVPPKRPDSDVPDDERPASPEVLHALAETPAQRVEQLAQCVHRVDKAPLVTSPELEATGRRRLKATKWAFSGTMLGINAFFVFSTWWWSKYYYVFLPLITITVALNCIMVFSIILHVLFRQIVPATVNVPETPESLVLLMPCYNETKEECQGSLDSLVNQIKIEQHQKAIFVVCDGRVRGPGMEKTTADYLLDDILVDKTERKTVPNAYTGWRTQPIDAVMQKGFYKGVPYFCVVKQQNQGKRDSLLLLRSFLYKFNIRETKPQVMFSPTFFGEMADFLTSLAHIDSVVHLIGMDADTIFAQDCVYELLQQSRLENTVGVCGYVAVDFKDRPWTSPFRLYQSTEYTISQGLRRLHQSVATHKVSCLPGCCQLLRVCETTCGDEVLLELFGYCPTPTDGMLKQIRATASEDRNHVCLMLSARSNAQTRQALRAMAYTDVPMTWSVFLSQRRRWTLGATSNDFMMISSPGIQWFERILAISNVMTWFLNFFILSSVASFIVACTRVEWWVVLAFASVMIVPLLYYIAIVLWLPRTPREKAQYMIGLCIYIFLGPFLNIIVLFYALWNMDNFSWGKTRRVIDDPELQLDAAREKQAEESSDAETPTGVPSRSQDSTATITPRTADCSNRSGSGSGDSNVTVTLRGSDGKLLDEEAQ